MKKLLLAKRNEMREGNLAKRNEMKTERKNGNLNEKPMKVSQTKDLPIQRYPIKAIMQFKEQMI